MKTVSEKTNSLIERRMGRFYLENGSIKNSQGELIRMYPDSMKDGFMTVEVVDQVPAKKKRFEIPVSVNCITTKCRIETSENELENALMTSYMGGNKYYNWVEDESGSEYVKEYTVSFNETDLSKALAHAKEYRLNAEREYRISIQMHDDTHFIN